MTHIDTIKEAINAAIKLEYNLVGDYVDKNRRKATLNDDALSAITALQEERKEMVDALEGMIEYSTYSESWQDNNPQFVEKARAILLKLGQQS